MTMDQLSLNGMYRILYSKTAECTSFSGTHGMFSRIRHILGHKTSANKFKKNRNCIEHIFFPNHKGT